MDEQAVDIEVIIRQVKLQIPASESSRLEVKNIGDDDGVWFFYIPGDDREIQLESSYGMCPFIVETDEQSSHKSRTAETVEIAVSMIVAYLSERQLGLS